MEFTDINPRVALLGSAILLFAAARAGSAQAPVRCPPAAGTVDSIIRTVESIAATDQAGRGWTPARSRIADAVTLPFEERVCPYFRNDVDKRAALVRLLEFAVEHDNGRIAGLVMQFTAAMAYRRYSDESWSPTLLLFQAIDDANSRAAKGMAFVELVRRATDDTIRRRLLAILRREVGPEGWPDLPTDLLINLRYAPSDGARLLLAEASARPDLLKNRLSRWIVECEPSYHRPRPPSDPCAPQNAPPRLGARG